MAVCLVAWTAVPESLRRFRWWSRPMISCRDEVSALTTTVAAQSVPRDANALWPGSDEDLRWRPSAFLACHFARSITNKLSKVDPQAARRRLEQLLSEVAPNGGGGTNDDGVSQSPSSRQQDNRVLSKPFE